MQSPIDVSSPPTIENPNIAKFVGTVIPQSKSVEYIKALSRDLVSCDIDKAKSYCTASGEVSKMKFSCVHINSTVEEKSEFVRLGGGIRIYDTGNNSGEGNDGEERRELRNISRPVIDLIGFVHKCPTVIRVRNWRPAFACRVPTCVDEELFIDMIEAELSISEFRTPIDRRVSDLTFSIREMLDCQEQEFLRSHKFVFIHSANNEGASRLIESSVRAYRKAVKFANRCLGGVGVNVITDNRIPHGVRKPLTEWERYLVKSELTVYPIRFSKGLSPKSLKDLACHFMSQEQISLTDHLWIEKGTSFDPLRDADIIMKFGVIIDWRTHSASSPAIRPRSIEKAEDNFYSNAICFSYDLETRMSKSLAGDKPRKFCDARVPGDYIMLAGCTLCRIGKKEYEAAFVLSHADHHSDPVEGLTIIECDGEKGLLITMFTILRYLPSYMFFNEFNGCEFDNKYILIRSMRSGCEDQLLNAFDIYQGESSAHGVKFVDNAKFKMDGGIRENLHRPDCSMKGEVDTRLQMVKRQPKEFQTAESLNVMLKYYKVIHPFTGEQMSKLDMKIDRMFKLWEDNSPSGIAEIIRYCFIDAWAAYLLLHWVNYFDDIYALGGKTNTTLIDSMYRADSKRIVQSITMASEKCGVAYQDVVPPKEYIDTRCHLPGTMLGGEVKALDPGVANDTESLDFASQYPAMIESNNISREAKVSPSILKNPETYGLIILMTGSIIDQYCSTTKPEWTTRPYYWICRAEDIDAVNLSIIRAKNRGSDNRDKGNPINRRDMYAAWMNEMAGLEGGKCSMEEVRRRTKLFYVEGFWTESDKELRMVYYIQSRRDAKGTVIDDYSIFRYMLGGLRNERKRIRGENSNWSKRLDELKRNPLPDAKQQEAELAVANVQCVSTNAAQLSVKTVMNACYGILNNNKFPTNDPESAGCITFCARRLVGFLRRLLGSNRIVLPKHIVDLPDFQILYGRLKRFGFSLSESYDYDYDCGTGAGMGMGTGMGTGTGTDCSDDMWKDINGDTMIQLHLVEERSGKSVRTWYTLTCNPAKVRYQDTDSSYYKFDAIEKFLDANQDMISQTHPIIRAFVVEHFEALGFKEEVAGKDTDSIKSAGRSAIERLGPENHDFVEAIRTCMAPLPTTKTSLKPGETILDKFCDAGSGVTNGTGTGTGTGPDFIAALKRYIDGQHQHDVFKVRLIHYYLIDHNDFMALILRTTINTFPIAVSNDGAFVVSYFSPMKKQYLGTKAPISKGDLWKINYDTLYPNLSDRRSNEFVGQFIGRKGIKVAGLNIIRRDTQQYIIGYLCKLYQSILKRNNTDGIVSAIHSLLKHCMEAVDTPGKEYIGAYSRTLKYKPTVINDVSEIVNRLRNEGKVKLVPETYGPVSFVLAQPKHYGTGPGYLARGLIDTGSKRIKYRMVEECDDRTRLDVQYYTAKLGKAFTAIAFLEILDDEIERSHNDTIREQRERLRDEYQGLIEDAVNPENEEARKKSMASALQRGHRLLMSRYFAIQGTVKEKKQEYQKDVVDNVKRSMTGVQFRDTALKSALALAYRADKPHDQLARKLLNAEEKKASRKKGQIQKQADLYTHWLRIMEARDKSASPSTSRSPSIPVPKSPSTPVSPSPSPSPSTLVPMPMSMPPPRFKAEYKEKEMIRIGKALIGAQGEALLYYGDLMRELQSFDEGLSAHVLSLHRADVPVTYEDIFKSIPIDTQSRMKIALADLDRVMERYMKALLDRRAFAQALTENGEPDKLSDALGV